MRRFFISLTVAVVMSAVVLIAWTPPAKSGLNGDGGCLEFCEEQAICACVKYLEGVSALHFVTLVPLVVVTAVYAKSTLLARHGKKTWWYKPSLQETQRPPATALNVPTLHRGDRRPAEPQLRPLGRMCVPNDFPLML